MSIQSPRAIKFFHYKKKTIIITGLTNMPDPRYSGIGWCQVQTLWIWQTCQTHVTLDLVDAKSRRLGSNKHARPMLLGSDKYVRSTLL